MSQTRRKLPVGIQTFREIREEDCYYVDKTHYATQLVANGKHYFLSRPRRFGKSLFVDTLKELFEGNEALFRGLAAHGNWDWSVHHPVVRLDFSGASFDQPQALEHDLADQLGAIEDEAGISASDGPPVVRFRRLVRELHRQTGRRVVVLVDEYDKPILDALDTRELAVANRAALRGLYSTVKFNDAHIRFSFFTGVTKFSKVSVFSDLNNLADITLHPAYSAICGYTDRDLDTVFSPELEGLDRQAIRDWYDGYRWLGEKAVYNPFDVLLLFEQRLFRAHWFETGTPTFVIRKLLDTRIARPSLDGLLATDDLLSAFDVDDMAVEELLFQTGYLTIADVHDHDGDIRYRLDYPNREVRQSFNRSLLRAMTPPESSRAATGADVRALLQANDFGGLEAVLRAFFASIPYNWHVANDIGDYEGYCASVFFAYFAATGLNVRTEDASSHGRLDMAVEFGSAVYLFEFKVVDDAPTGEAMAHLKARRYADKNRTRGLPAHLIGVEFSRKDRNLAAFETERA
ncbi:MAG: AAA family ATPase [Gammaproteobacteria bacterium]|nr:AAA family ATPase [Gammaproteobacteria bacterium]